METRLDSMVGLRAVLPLAWKVLRSWRESFLSDMVRRCLFPGATRLPLGSVTRLADKLMSATMSTSSVWSSASRSVSLSALMAAGCGGGGVRSLQKLGWPHVLWEFACLWKMSFHYAKTIDGGGLGDGVGRTRQLTSDIQSNILSKISYLRPKHLFRMQRCSH